MDNPREPKVPVELTVHQYGNIMAALRYYASRDALKLFLPGAKPERWDEILRDLKSTADDIVDQVHQYRVSCATKDDAGVVHLHLWNMPTVRLFTYTCKECGGSMTVEADDGHPAHQYWVENHRCRKLEG